MQTSTYIRDVMTTTPSAAPAKHTSNPSLRSLRPNNLNDLDVLVAKLDSIDADFNLIQSKYQNS